MFVLKTIVGWGWSPILITALAVVGYIYKWPSEAMAPALVIILVIGMVVAVTRARERRLEFSTLRFKQLAGYFNRRFTGNSPLSLFAIIESLLNIDDPKLWDWVRVCDVSQRIFNTWCNSFTSRVESDVRTGRFALYLRTYLNELWLLTSHYYEFIEQVYEVAEKFEIPEETRAQYNRFAVEYNAFVQDFRDNISGLKKVANTEIEPPSVRLAKELAVVR